MKELFLLIAAHGLVDFTFQTEWIAREKNRHLIPERYDPELHGARQTVWPYVLTAHAIQHGLAVCLITGSVGLGVAETIAHWVIDFLKCEKVYGIHVDQFLHLVCKILWWKLA